MVNHCPKYDFKRLIFITQKEVYVIGENTMTAGGIASGTSADVNGTGNQQGLQGENGSATAHSNAKAAENTPQGGKTYSEKELQAETDRRVSEALRPHGRNGNRSMKQSLKRKRQKLQGSPK